MDDEGTTISEHGNKSTNSTRSKAKTWTGVGKEKDGHCTFGKDTVSDYLYKAGKLGKLDSRDGDFLDDEEGEEQDSVVNSDIMKINSEIKELEPEREDGLVQDSELPEDLEDDEVFERLLTSHKEKLEACAVKEKRLARLMELHKVRREIQDRARKAKQMEWQIGMDKKRELLDKKRKERQRKEEEMALNEELHLEEKRLIELDTPVVTESAHATYSNRRDAGKVAAGKQVDKHSHVAQWVNAIGEQTQLEPSSDTDDEVRPFTGLAHMKKLDFLPKGSHLVQRAEEEEMAQMRAGDCALSLNSIIYQK